MKKFQKTALALVIFFTLTTYSLTAKSKDSDAEKMKSHRIVVLSYNIHHGEGLDKKFDLERIAKIIKSVSPDIVSLQEVDKKTSRSSGVDQIEGLARLTGMKYVYGKAIDFAGGQYGNAVLTKFPIESSKCIPLPGKEPRSALFVTVRLADKTLFTFIATHLDIHREQRLESIPVIESYLKSNNLEPAILAGDLNGTPKSPTMKGFFKTWNNATSKEKFFTYTANSHRYHIDYVLYRPKNAWKVLETKVLDEAVASDHRPVLAVLELSPGTK